MTRRQRLTLLAAILGSAVVMIDGSIVSVALPAIERDLGGALATPQWVANAYLLVLGSLILIAGSLGDIYGKRRVFATGIAAFGIFSLACEQRADGRRAARGARASGRRGSAGDAELAGDHRRRVRAERTRAGSRSRRPRARRPDASTLSARASAPSGSPESSLR